MLVGEISLLRQAIARTRMHHPFHIDAWVIWPNHMHAVWTSPGSDADFSLRWWDIKRYVSTSVADDSPRSASRARQGERGMPKRTPPYKIEVFWFFSSEKNTLPFPQTAARTPKICAMA